MPAQTIRPEANAAFVEADEFTMFVEAMNGGRIEMIHAVRRQAGVALQHLLMRFVRDFFRQN